MVDCWGWKEVGMGCGVEWLRLRIVCVGRRRWGLKVTSIGVRRKKGGGWVGGKCETNIVQINSVMMKMNCKVY